MFRAALFLVYLTAISCAAALPSKPRADACSTPHQSGYNDNPNNHQVVSGGRTRTYAISVPPGYNDLLGKQWPMIIDYHGNNGTPKQQYENSQYYKYPKGQQYIVVCE